MKIVTSERLIEGMRDVDSPYVSVAGNACIACAYLMRQRKSDGRGPNQKAVLVDVECGLVVVVKRAEIQIVAARDEVVPIKIRHVYRLIAMPPSIQTAIGVLFEQIEVGEIVLEDVI